MTQTPPQATGKSLFSLHYLATRLPAQPEWQEDAQPAFAAVRALWQKAAALGANWNEAQTEDEFVRPDYALFGDAATRDAAYPRQGDDAAFYGPALAIAEAKYWGRALSKQAEPLAAFLHRRGAAELSRPSPALRQLAVGGGCPHGGSGDPADGERAIWSLCRAVRRAARPDRRNDPDRRADRRNTGRRAAQRAALCRLPGRADALQTGARPVG
jgi:hypothetical protein